MSIVGIDASRNRSGGAKAHLVGILESVDPREYGIQQVHLWSYQALAESLPNYPWLAKHSPSVLESSLPRQMWWQYRELPKKAVAYGCELMFNTDSGSVCPFNPAVTLNQDLLSFEPGEMWRFGPSYSLARLLVLRGIQVRSLKRAKGAIFLTNYAARVIQRTTGPLEHCVVVPHGVGDEFRQTQPPGRWPQAADEAIRIVYVSNAAVHKHQWQVVRAVSALRDRGHSVSLLLVGGGSGRPQRLLTETMADVDPRGELVTQRPFVAHHELPGVLRQANLFVFASSCETFGITLLEAMAAGLPIACSRRSALPEVLGDAGVYFDPERPATIADALEKLIVNAELREDVASRALRRSEEYSWERCARQTWAFLCDCLPR